MKLIFLFITFFFPSVIPSPGIYDLQVQSLDGSMINLSVFEGKKILVAEFNAESPDQTFLTSLNTLQNADSNLVVIAVPAMDFGGMASISNLQTIKTSLSLSYLVTQPAKVSKKSGTVQLPLFKWLTNVADNTHFDVDITNEGQMFLISEKGNLYGVIGKGTPLQTITKLLSQSINY